MSIFSRCLVGSGEEKKSDGACVLSLQSTKIFSPKKWEKIEENSHGMK